MAGVYGKHFKCSEWMRRGLVESLVLLAVYGERISRAIDGPQEFADAVVHDILAGAHTWQAWASLKDIMPLLAEAAPDAFLDIVEEKIEADSSLFKDLMHDEENRYGFGDCQHSGLVWALEGIAWHPEYVVRVARVVTSLAIVDPGGRWSNRPLASLTDILLPGVPQTHASPEQRLAAYDVVIQQDPRIAWKIAERHMNGGVISASHTFRWRESGGPRAPLGGELRKDYIAYITGLVPRWAELAGATNENLAAAVLHFFRLQTPVRDQVLAALKDIDATSLSKEDRRVLLRNLRHTLHWITNYGRKNKHKKYLPMLRQAYNALTPTDTLDRVDWLFIEGFPELPDESARTRDGERLGHVRKKAARDLLDDVPLAQVLDYGEALNHPAILSSSLARAVRTKKEDAALVDALAARVIKNSWLLVGYSMGRIEEVGGKWATEQIERLKKEGNFTPEAGAALLRGLPESGTTWATVAPYGTEVEQAYWQWASGYTRSDHTKEQDTTTAVEKLLSVGRPEVAVECAGDAHISLPSALLKQVLLISSPWRVRQRKISTAECWSFT
jgi:hypothetical protein